MPSYTEVSEHVAEELDSWFETNYEAFPTGIEKYVVRSDDRKGVHVLLSEEIDTDRFKQILIEEDEFEPSVPEGETDAVAPQRVEEIDGGILYKSAYGTTFHRTDVVPLGGYDHPIDSRGEPASSSVAKTLEMLVLYLEDYADAT